MQIRYLIEKQVEARKTVAQWFEQFTQLLSNQDRKDEATALKRRMIHNHHRIAMWLEAMYRAKETCKGILDRTDGSALVDLKSALSDEFLPDFPPLRKILRAIDTELATEERDHEDEQD